ncbi:MAG: glycolate oxidase iron-sulfur subunit [Pseudomonadota bacterium]|jgi:glycolate oxidase iron-sulfur subunit
MEITLSDLAQQDPKAHEAADIIRRCVHCGFCTATCPTYQLLGDERDGPRGRIYMIKQMLEGDPVTQETQLHLDRCLTCRNCETTCPSGVEYGRLVDLGREMVDQKVSRPLGQRIVRGLLREGLTSRWFDPAAKIGRAVRPLLPSVLSQKLPEHRPSPLRWPTGHHPRKVIVPRGCVQPSLLPNIDLATAVVLDRLGIECVVPEHSGCCGAVRHHLADGHGALAEIRRNVMAWWPQVATGAVEAIVVNASGCAVMVKDYGRLMAAEPEFAEKAATISRLARDPIDILSPLLPELQKRYGPINADTPGQKIAYHPPCTQQHGLKIRGAVEAFLHALGVAVQPVADSHLCCGSAGTYSVLQPALAETLKAQKVEALTAGDPDWILSANVGCIGHLQTGTSVRVAHWIEWLEEHTRP